MTGHTEMVLMTSALLLAGCASGMANAPTGSSLDLNSGEQARVRTAPAPARTASLADRLLAVHNGYRVQAQVPLLVWDAQLAAGAAAYGPILARQGQLAHSPRSARPGIGENLWMGTAGAYSPESMVDSWGAERRYYRDGVFPNVSSTGNWLDVSHYTAMIWRPTTRVGCALHRSGRWDYLICRYSPSGNRDGQRVR
jgi:hypothetical protein